MTPWSVLKISLSRRAFSVVLIFFFFFFFNLKVGVRDFEYLMY